MKNRRATRSLLILFAAFLFLSATSPVLAQSEPRKVRIGVSETHVGYLPLQVAFHKSYYKDEGIDLEIVLMPTNVINTAALCARLAARPGVHVGAQKPRRGGARSS